MQGSFTLFFFFITLYSSFSQSNNSETLMLANLADENSMQYYISLPTDWNSM